MANSAKKVIGGQKLRRIGSCYFHALDHLREEHQEFSEDFLYSSEQIEAFNNLIHFFWAKTHVLDFLVRQYCHEEDRGLWTP